jgi:CCR4-NOT transcription complex subunit 3
MCIKCWKGGSRPCHSLKTLKSWSNEHLHANFLTRYARPKYYVPRNPYPTAPYYPQSPHPSLGTTGIFSQLDVETLFYVFYFLPGTYQQCVTGLDCGRPKLLTCCYRFLAAKELKRQSWRFHVKYLTWFQRHSEPQAITEEYEQGVYVYFDWEGSWCQRKKSDFRFEYRYLSED